MGLMRVFSSDHYYWKMVERDAATPWFYLTIQYGDKGNAREKSFMPDDHILVEQILSQQQKGVKVVDLQAMTPSTINRQGRWLMEPLSQLELAETARGETVQIYTTIYSQVYFYPSLSQSAIKKLRARRMLYKRTADEIRKSGDERA